MGTGRPCARRGRRPSPRRPLLLRRQPLRPPRRPPAFLVALVMRRRLWDMVALLRAMTFSLESISILTWHAQFAMVSPMVNLGRKLLPTRMTIPSASVLNPSASAIIVPRVNEAVHGSKMQIHYASTEALPRMGGREMCD